MFPFVEKCCDNFTAAIDGVQGWGTEVLTVLGVVLVFNFLAKWILKKLHYRFKEQKRYWHDSFVRALYLPLSYFVWFFAFIHITQLIGRTIFDVEVFADTHMWLKVGGIIALGWFAMRWKKNLVRIMTSKVKNNEIALEQGKIDVVNKLMTMIIFFFIILLLLEATDRSINTLIAFGGVGGLAIAFASQELIANFFGGLLVYMTQPFEVGDWINLPEKNIEGHVEEIGWYTTRVRTFEKRPIYIPNALFSKMVVMTPSRMTHRQFKEIIGIRYEDRPKLLKIIADIKQMLEQHAEIDQTQRFRVFLTAFGTHSLDIQISALTLTTSNYEYAALRQDLFLKIWDILEKHQAQMAVPVTYVQLLDKGTEGTKAT